MARKILGYGQDHCDAEGQKKEFRYVLETLYQKLVLLGEFMTKIFEPFGPYNNLRKYSMHEVRNWGSTLSGKGIGTLQRLEKPMKLMEASLRIMS